MNAIFIIALMVGAVAMSKFVIENLQLKISMKGLKDENTDLKMKLGHCQSERLMKERHLNVTKDNHANCSSDKTRLEDENGKLVTSFDRCVKVKKSLEDDLIVNMHTLNASHQAKEKYLQQLNNCRATLAAFLESCKAWFNAGYTQDGNYIIDPDGPGGVDHFEVECDMQNYYGEPVTLVHHDSENKMDAGNSEAAYSNIRDVHYKVTMKQIQKLVELSTNCEQDIKYECYGSFISDTATWYSRDGTPMYYWGGAKPGSRKCACGMTNSCDDIGAACNCDTYVHEWRSDSGLLTDKSTLPVTKMAFGDLGADTEHGFHRLGALRCYG